MALSIPRSFMVAPRAMLMSSFSSPFKFGSALGARGIPRRTSKLPPTKTFADFETAAPAASPGPSTRAEIGVNKLPQTRSGHRNVDLL
eukprot:6660788-Pyramimonas_sp.AAC.1